MASGTVVALNAYKATEAAERVTTGAAGNGGSMYIRADGDFWSRIIYISCFMRQGVVIRVGVNPGKSFAGIALHMMGAQVAAGGFSSSGPPFCALLASNDGIGGRQWELHHHAGAGVPTVDVLTGVPTPTDSGAQRTNRLEILYVPNVCIEAAIDGFVGVRAVQDLPNPAHAPSNIENMAGLMVHSGPDVNDSTVAEFGSLMIENYFD